MSSSDVSRHINTIELQLEVTRFLQRCESSASSRGSASAAAAALPSGGTPATDPVRGQRREDRRGLQGHARGQEYRRGIWYRLQSHTGLPAGGAVGVHACGAAAGAAAAVRGVRQLLKCVGESGTATKSDCDSIVLSCVAVADKGPADAKELEGLILESKSTDNKIKAYLLCSKLRAAYLLAVKLEPSGAGPLVQEILQAAEGTGDSVMQDICRQWLSEHQDRAPRQRQGAGSAR
ncbi:hypothetical protein ANANG_G00023990 [Anguilla anguilla]|uniref:ZFYVE26-like TPR repeats domain-containing protein n=1 Tax=Anguilla anguilla TaxID=7936 RepID=A0A9D3N1Z3_ANGAN|nr:hypothetical protein ANANG_G00023990 [Anguilla anguilla]